MLRMKLRFAAFQPLLVIPEVFLRPRDKIPARVSTPMPFRDCSLEFAGAISPSVRVPSRSHALLNVVSGPADVHGQQVTIPFRRRELRNCPPHASVPESCAECGPGSTTRKC